jgi:hypothetical protein
VYELITGESGRLDAVLLWAATHSRRFRLTLDGSRQGAVRLVPKALRHGQAEP